jgi:hypothetical protein
MATAFIEAIEGLTVSPRPLEKFTSRNDFAEFHSSSFPLFALEPGVSESDLKAAADMINKQAATELGFGEKELAEMGYAASVPQPWQLHEKAPPDAVRWYHDKFDKEGSSETDDPQWYPLGFLGIASKDWRETGVVVVFYDAQPGSEDVPIKAYRADPQKIGSIAIDLRQGDDDYDNVKRHSAMR